MDPTQFLPLTPPTFQILLSLHGAPMHGYALIADIRERTADEVRLTASTLYDALARMLDQGLIAECDNAPTPAATGAGNRADARRRYYSISDLGRAVTSAEARRLERLLAMAREKRVVSR